MRPREIHTIRNLFRLIKNLVAFPEPPKKRFNPGYFRRHGIACIESIDCPLLRGSVLMLYIDVEAYYTIIYFFGTVSIKCSSVKFRFVQNISHLTVGLRYTFLK